MVLDDRNFAAKLEKTGKINTDEPYQTRGLAPRVRWRYTSRHDTPYARFELTANATPTPPTPTQTCLVANADATGDFVFFGTSLPKNKGAGWGGGGAPSSSSSINPQLPQQQQRAPGETR